MNLVIDQGNTFTKIGIFDKGTLIHSDSNKKFDKKLVDQVMAKYSIGKLIVSSVQKDYADIDEIRTQLGIDSSIHIHLLGSKSKLPIKINYKTPHTFGKDRLAALVGAHQLYKGSPKLIIDAGTAVTIDYIDAKGVFSGGNISPGLQTRFNALQHNTKKLPLLKPNADTPFMGLSTDEAIWSGVQNGLVFEIDGYINLFNKLDINTKVILTGGDAYFFVKKLKNTIFVNLNLVQSGLNTILEYNAKNK